MSEIRPFLATLAAPKQAAPFAATLPVVETPRATSPWTPQPPRVEAPAVPAIDVEAVRAEAAARGREDGLRETAALRAKLQQLIEGLAATEAETRAVRANLIADAAATVVAAWTQRAAAGEAFAPIVRSWLAKTTAATTARVCPGDVDALRAAIGDAAIEIVADPAIAPGGLALRTASHELIHSWDERLAELREAVRTALEVTS